MQLHHAVYRQELRRIARERTAAGPPDVAWELILVTDRRNLVPLGPKCHAAHHGRSRPLPMHRLPDSVFEFAGEVLGAERAYEYLRRRYAGGDPRHDALLSG